jgi:hypothetical protein
MMKTNRYWYSNISLASAVAVMAALAATGPATAADWTPAELDYALWLDASDLGTLATNGAGLVSAWTNKGSEAGADAVQTDENLRPTWSATAFNGKPGVTFDGIDDVMSLGTGLNLEGEFIVIIAGRVTTLDNDCAPFMAKWKTSDPKAKSYWFGVGPGENPKTQLRGYATADGSENSYIARLEADPVSTNSAINALSGNGSVMRVWYNGTAGATTANLGSIYSGAATVMIGSDILGGGVSYGPVTIAECIMSSVPINDGKGRVFCHFKRGKGVGLHQLS